MNNTVPNLDSQFISLDSWLYETEEQSISMDLPSDDAMFVSELFVQHIVPSIAGNHAEDSGSHSDPGPFSSKIPPPVVPVQSLVDDDHIVRVFTVQHRGVLFDFDFFLLHTAQLNFMTISPVHSNPKQCRTVQLDAL
ncbi:hypothetical protein J3R83DRAFT_3775 [Lanmaoa asiatica]|nr:hypothetical protein J3R83DRAFT_3775 [Lanmaoa asiatica]